LVLNTTDAGRIKKFPETENIFNQSLAIDFLLPSRQKYQTGSETA